MKKIFLAFVALSAIIFSCSSPTETPKVSQNDAQAAFMSISGAGLAASLSAGDPANQTPDPSDSTKFTGTITNPTGGSITFIYQTDPSNTQHFTITMTFSNLKVATGEVLNGTLIMDMTVDTSTPNTMQMASALTGSIQITGGKVSNLVFSINQTMTTNKTTGITSGVMSGSLTADGTVFNLNLSY